MVKKCWKQWNQTKPKGDVNVGLCRVVFKMHLPLNGMLFYSVHPFNCFCFGFYFVFFFASLLVALIQCVRMVSKDASSSFCDETRNWPCFFVFFFLLSSFLSFKWQNTHDKLSWWHVIKTFIKKEKPLYFMGSNWTS